MDQSLVVLECAKCGANLPRNLICPHCGKHHMIKWSTATPNLNQPTNKYYPRRDRTLDSVLLTALQSQASQLGAELLLVIHPESFRISILVRHPVTDKFVKSAYVNPHPHHGAGSYHLKPDGGIVHLHTYFFVSWSHPLGESRRVYQIHNDFFVGEDELLQCQYVQYFATSALAIAQPQPIPQPIRGKLRIFGYFD